MDVRLSPEQHALRDSAAQIVDRLGPRAVGQLADGDRAGRLAAAVDASGWRELRTPVDDGAPLASGVEVALVAEELGRGLADAAFLGPTLAAELRRLAGAPPAPDTGSPTSPSPPAAPTGSGSTSGSSAVTAPNAAWPAPGSLSGSISAMPAGSGSPPGSTSGTASAPGAGLEVVAFAPDLGALAIADLDGALPAGAVAVDTDGATSALVLVPTGGGFALARVPLGRVPDGAEGTDLTRGVVAIPPGAGVDEVAGQVRALTSEDVERVTGLGLAATCADLVGVMRGAVQLAADYAKERRQYGVAIGSFQAVQHLLADALVATEGSRSVALHAAWAVDALPPSEASAAAAVAKAWCARAARTVCETAIQVHGGIGNTWECLAHVFLRRALLSTDVLGGTGPSLGRVLEHHGIGAGDGVR